MGTDLKSYAYFKGFSTISLIAALAEASPASLLKPDLVENWFLLAVSGAVRERAWGAKAARVSDSVFAAIDCIS